MGRLWRLRGLLAVGATSCGIAGCALLVGLETEYFETREAGAPSSDAGRDRGTQDAASLGDAGSDALAGGDAEDAKSDAPDGALCNDTGSAAVPSFRCGDAAVASCSSQCSGALACWQCNDAGSVIGVCSASPDCSTGATATPGYFECPCTTAADCPAAFQVCAGRCRSCGEGPSDTMACHACGTCFYAARACR